MKNILRTSIFAFMLMALGACENDTDPVAVSGNGVTLLNPIADADYVLDPATQNEVAMTAVWDYANTGVPSASSYVVQFALPGTNFENPAEVGPTNERFLAVTGAEFNGKLLDLGLAPYEEAEVEMRVVSRTGNSENAMMQYSNAVTINVTPFTTDNPRLYVIGNFLSASGYGADWTPAATLPYLEASAFGKTDFEGYVYMNVAAPEYKFLPTNTSFDGDWADDGAFAGGLAQEGETNALANAPGYYYVKANTGAVTPQNLDGLTYSATLTTWGIAGNATANGWDGMTPMTYDPVTKKWSIVATLTTQVAPDNGLKFKANGAWDINLGDNGADGTAEYGGTNIGTTAGTYLITLDLSNPRNYTYTLTPQ